MDEITPSEWKIGAIVVLVLMALALFLNPLFKAGMLDELRVYQEAVKIEGDAQLFQYAAKTGAGNVLAYGEFAAEGPVTFSELTGQYGLVTKYVERYTRHSRQVCASRDKKGNCTFYRTEYYYTWDAAGHETRVSPSFIFLGQTFTQDQLLLSAKEEVRLGRETVRADLLPKVAWGYLYQRSPVFASAGDLRYHYGYLPIKFNASALMHFSGVKMTDPMSGTKSAKVFYKELPAQVVADKRNFLQTFDVIYYICWFAASAGLYLGLAYKVLEVE